MNKFTGLILISIIGFFIYKFGIKSEKVVEIKSVRENTLYEQISDNVPTFNPQESCDNVSNRVLNDTFEGLVNYNLQSTLEYTGATNYDVSDDGTVYIFHLRKNAKWSNGDPVTAHDYVFSWKYASDPATQTKYWPEAFDYIKNGLKIKNKELKSEFLGVSAIDDYTLKIELESPVAIFVDLLCVDVLRPIHKKTVERFGIGWANNIKNIVCNGPYVFNGYVNNGYVELKKNNYYWDKDKVKIPFVKFKVISDKNTALSEFRSGNIDIVKNFPQNSADYYSNQFGNQYRRYPILGVYYCMLNFNDKRFQDKRVRKALSMTINRHDLCEKIIKKNKATYNILPDGISENRFSNIEDQIEEYNWIKLPMEERMKIAKDLLNEAGYNKDNPLIFSIKMNKGHENIFAFIQNNWNVTFGDAIKINIDVIDWKVFLSNIDQGNFEISRQGWIADFNQSSNFLQLFYSDGANNYAKYSNSVFDDLYKKSMLTNNQDDYYDLQKQAVKVILNDYAIIPIYSYENHILINKRVKNFDTNNFFMERFSSKDLNLS